MSPTFNPSHPSADVHLITLDDVRLHARWYPGPDDADENPCYLLGHGFTGSARRPRVVHICQQLAGRGASVLSLDFRGHGASGGRASVGATEHADVAAGVSWLRAHHPARPVVLLGFSMGASVVIRHAGLGGDADAVVAVSGPGRWFVRSTKPMRRLNRGLETPSGRRFLAVVMKTRVDRSWDGVPAAPVELVSNIAVPLLVVHGDADPYFSLEHPRMLVAGRSGSELWIESGMGHAETATSDELLDRIDNWVRSELATGPGGRDRSETIHS